MQLRLDGRAVHVATGGKPFDPARPCLVLIHGAQHDHFVWQPVLACGAAADHAVLAVDLPGHGRSAGPPLPSIEAMADWLLALLEKVGAGGTANSRPTDNPGTANSRCTDNPGTANSRCTDQPGTPILAGHSMGSLVALEAASRRPDRVAHLVLVGTAVPMPVAPALLQAARESPSRAMATINQWSHSRRALLGACGGPGLWLPAINLRIMERQPPATLHNDLAACDAYRQGEAAAARLACPVTLVAGSQDRMTSAKAARRFAAQWGERARLVELAGVGHALMAEAPAAVAAVLRNILSGRN